jgi:hypothetical protein
LDAYLRNTLLEFLSFVQKKKRTQVKGAVAASPSCLAKGTIRRIFAIEPDLKERLQILDYNASHADFVMRYKTHCKLTKLYIMNG